mgnify:CR=1 FL=1
MAIGKTDVDPTVDRPVYWNSYIAGAALGVLLFTSFLLTGNGLGASGGIQRVIVAIEDLVVPSYVDRTPNLATLAGGDRKPLNNWIVIEILGALVGGFLSGLIHRRLRIETRKGPRISKSTRWAMAFLGGAIMGYGARLARGCTSGQALSGGCVLSAGSWAFMLSIFASAYALAYFLRKAWN